MTVEPKVEELLASIRKAIDDDDAAEAHHPAAKNHDSTFLNEQGKLLRGSMREMRMSVDASPVRQRNVDAEIEGIRAKVDRKFADASAPRPQPSSGPFSSIMAGNTSRRERRDSYEPEYPPMREAFPPASDYNDTPPPRRYRDDYEPYPESQAQQRPRQTSLMSTDNMRSTEASFDRLAETIMTRIGGDRTIEDITRELLRGMLRQWLDDNLPPLVERLVRDEIERVARRGR